MGTNSTRLLVADVVDGVVDPIHRESRVTGLGRGVETSGQLATEAIENVYEAVGDYQAILTDLGAEEIFAFATSAARDASNSEAFLAELRERFALQAKVIGGLEEAELTYRGARDGGYIDGETLVLDIGGGSTELIVGSSAKPAFNTSLQIGVVRHTERHIHTDPPQTNELESLAEDIGSAIDSQLATFPGLRAERGVAARRNAGDPGGHRPRTRARRLRAGRGPRAGADDDPEPLLAALVAAAGGAPRGPRRRPRSRADHRRRRDHPDQGDARLRDEEDRGLRARHPVRRRGAGSRAARSRPLTCAGRSGGPGLSPGSSPSGPRTRLPSGPRCRGARRAP